MASCSVAECSNNAHCRGLCPSHYNRLKRYGDPLGGSSYQTPSSVAVAFLEAVVANPPNECVIWPYAKRSSGYGSVWFNGKWERAHRAALESYTGPAPKGKPLAAHAPEICHNPSCVNPKHLRWASHTENANDMRKDKTMMSGEKSPTAKLRSEDVITIRADDRTYKEIARDYNVDSSTIGRIKRRDSWKSVI